MSGDPWLRLTLLKSVHGRLKSHQQCVRGLGLMRRHQTVMVPNTPAIRGMVNKVRYMLDVEQLNSK